VTFSDQLSSHIAAPVQEHPRKKVVIRSKPDNPSFSAIPEAAMPPFDFTPLPAIPALVKDTPPKTIFPLTTQVDKYADSLKMEVDAHIKEYSTPPLAPLTPAIEEQADKVIAAVVDRSFNVAAFNKYLHDAMQKFSTDFKQPVSMNLSVSAPSGVPLPPVLNPVLGTVVDIAAVPVAVPPLPSSLPVEPVVSVPSTSLIAPPSIVPSTYLQNVRGYTAGVSPSNRRVQKSLTDLGIGWHHYKNDSNLENPHSVAAAVRAVRTVHALATLYERGCRKVVSIYGSDRDLRFNDRLNEGVLSGQQMTLTLHKPIVTAQDIARVSAPGVPYITTLEPSEYDGFLMVNIFDVEKQYRTVPDLCARLVEYGPVVWLGHEFRGAYGVFYGEAAWIRTPDDKIIHSPDATSRHYGPDTDSTPWCQAGSKAGMTWAPVRTAQGFVEMLFVAQTTLPASASLPMPASWWRDLPALPDPEGYRAKIWYWYADWATTGYTMEERTRWYTTRCPTTRVMVDCQGLIRLREWFSGRARTQFVLNQANQRLYATYADNPDMALLQERFPSYLEPVVHNTTLVAFYADLVAQSGQLRSHALAYSHYTNIFNQQLQMMASAVPSYSFLAKFLQAVIILTLVGLFTYGWEYLPATWAASVYTRLLTMALHWAAAFTLPRVFARLLTLDLRAPSDSAEWMLTILAGSMMLVDPLWGLCFLPIPMSVKVYCAPFYEEWIKRGPTGAAFIALEAWQHSLMALKRGDPLFATIGAGLFALIAHFALLCCPLWLAITLHLAWNICATPDTPEPQVDNNWDVFTQHYYRQPWTLRLLFNDTRIAVHRFPLQAGILPKEAETYTPSKPRCKLMKLKTNHVLLDPYPAKSAIYWILPTNVPCYSPAKSDHNLWSVIVNRVCIEPPMDPTLQAAVWEEIGPELLTFCEQQPPIIRDQVYLAWFLRFDGASKGRITATARKWLESPLAPKDKRVQKTALMVKTDELLFKFSDTHPMMRPRPIANVPNVVQYIVGPYTWEASNRLKILWNGSRIFSLGNFKFRVLYCSGVTDAFLTDMMELMQTSSVPVIAAGGDDSIVCRIVEGKLVWDEGDASMYDQSQSFGPLDFELDVLTTLGIPDDILDVLEDMTGKPYMAWFRDETYAKIDMEDRVIRPTGGPNTTLGNTIIMIMSWIYVLSHNLPPKEGFAKLGFDMKFKFHYEPTAPTFLKGMWYECTDGLLRWGPLPSRILKAGKLLTDPRTLYPYRSYYASCEQFLNDLACQYAVGLQVPVMRAFVKRYLQRPRERVVNWGDRFAPRLTHNFNVTLESSAHRYGLTVEDLLVVEGLIAVSDPGTFLCHPAFMAMALKDYN